MVVLKLLHTRSFETSFPYLGQKRNKNADEIPEKTRQRETADGGEDMTERKKTWNETEKESALESALDRQQDRDNQ